MAAGEAFQVLDKLAAKTKETAGKMKAGLSSGLRNELSGLKAQIAGVFTLGAITAFVSKVMTTGAEIKDMAERLGTSAEFAQKLVYNFEDIGGSAEDATRAIEKMDQARLAALADPEGKEAVAFRAIGVDQNDMLKDREGLYTTLGNQLKDHARTAEEMNAMADIFGDKLAGKVLTAAEAMTAAFTRAKDAGLVMGNAVIDQLDTIEKAFGRMKKERVVEGADYAANLYEGSMVAGIALGKTYEEFKEEGILSALKSLLPVGDDALFSRLSRNYNKTHDDLEAKTYQIADAKEGSQGRRRKDRPGLAGCLAGAGHVGFPHR